MITAGQRGFRGIQYRAIDDFSHTRRSPEETRHPALCFSGLLPLTDCELPTSNLKRIGGNADLVSCDSEDSNTAKEKCEWGRRGFVGQRTWKLGGYAKFYCAESRKRR